MLFRTCKLRRKPGFSLVEVIIAAVILIAGAATLVPVVGQFQANRILNVSTHDVEQALAHAKGRAASGKNDAAWGVKFTESGFTVFAGDSYASRNTAYDETSLLPSQYVISGLDEVVFAQLTGLTSADGVIWITHDPTTKRLGVSVTPALLVMAVGSSSSSSSSSVAPPGSPSNPFLISSCQELQNMNNNLAASYMLAVDVNCNVSPFNTGAGFSPVGSSTAFSGTLDGNGHSVAGLFINSAGTDDAGLFAVINNATVKNLTLSNASITGKDNVGGLAARMQGSSVILNVQANGGSVKGADNVGGLIGKVSGGSITGSSTSISLLSNAGNNGNSFGGIAGYLAAGATVTTSHTSGNALLTKSNPQMIMVGGIVGQLLGSVTKSYATGNISGHSHIGGVIGGMVGLATVSDCYATGSVTGQNKSSGLVGTGEGTILRSYAVGRVTVNASPSGGIVTQVGSYPLTVTNAFYDTQTTTQDDTTYGTPKTTAQMQQQSTFTGWDFGTVWAMNQGVSYPTLR